MVDSVDCYLSLVGTLQKLVAFMLYHVGVGRCWVAKIWGRYKFMLCPVTLLSEIWEARVPAS